MFLEWENNSQKLQIISGKFQNSGEFQNNAINDVKQVSLSHVIIKIWLRKQVCRKQCNYIRSKDNKSDMLCHTWVNEFIDYNNHKMIAKKWSSQWYWFWIFPN